MEENTREVRIRRISKELMGCVQAMVGKKKLLFQLENGKKKDIISSSLVYVCSRKEVCHDMGEPISNIPEK